jgi:hypothetical protein
MPCSFARAAPVACICGDDRGGGPDSDRLGSGDANRRQAVCDAGDSLEVDAGLARRAAKLVSFIHAEAMFGGVIHF